MKKEITIRVRLEPELADLPADVLALGKDTLKQLIEWSNRVETPHERMERLKQGVNFARVNEAVWVRFYDDGKAQAVVSERQWIEVKRDGVPMIFGPEDPAAALSPKTEVLAYFAPHDPDRAHLTVNGRYVGSWPRLRGGGRGDADAKRAGIARSQRFLKAAVAGVRGKSGEDLVKQAYRSQQITALSAAAVPVLARAAETRLQEICTPGAEGLQAMNARHEGNKARAAEVRRNVDRFGAAAAEEFLAVGEAGEEPGELVASEPSAGDDFLNAL